MQIGDQLRETHVLAKLGEWRSAEISWVTIQENLKSEFNLEASVPVIQNAYSTYSARSAEIIAGDEMLKGTLKRAVVKAADTLSMIHARVTDILIRSEDENNVLGAADRLMKFLELQKKLLEHMREGFDLDKVNSIEYVKVSRDNLSELAKAGYIKILRRPGEPFDKNAKETVKITQQHIKELNQFGEAHTEIYRLLLADKDIKEAEIVSEEKTGGEIKDEEKEN